MISPLNPKDENLKRTTLAVGQCFGERQNIRNMIPDQEGTHEFTGQQSNVRKRIWKG